MKTKNFISKLFVCLLGLAAPPVLASTYYLNQSNTLADGVNYAQVDVLENGGNLDFTVTALTPANWKFSNFYFNLGGNVGTVTLSGLPTGWSADSGQNVSAFGIFSDGEKGTGGTLKSALTFTADSTVALALSNLVPNAVGGAGWIFAAHVQCQDKTSSPCSAVGSETSHFIAGPEVSTVPLPAAAWLFGSALLGFVSLSNRRKV